LWVYGGNTSFRSLLGSHGVSSSNTYGAINTSRIIFFHDETQLFCTNYKIISHYESMDQKTPTCWQKMSLQKKENLGKEGIENYLRSWCKQSYERSKINTSLLLHESTTMSMGQEK
jgi:hypothetical protein